MKVLLLNPEMVKSFWYFPYLYALPGARTLSPPLSLITLAALLPREWELRLVDLNARQPTDQDWQWADLVMVSGMIAQRQSLLGLVRESRHRGKMVVAGGPYPTSVPEEVLEAGCDFLVRGEGENAVPLLLSALKQGERGGVLVPEGKPDLTFSPVPRFDLLQLPDYLALSLQTSRGCPFDCEFCDVVKLYGRKPRYKDWEQVRAELEAIYRLGWRRDVFIVDDNFIGHPARARKILRALIPWMKSHGEPFTFWTQASVNLGQEQELLDLMTEANFSTVILGLESPDRDVLATTHKYHNLRHPLEESLTNICKGGLNVVGSFIIGFDGEKPGVGRRIAALMEATHLPMAVLNLLQPLPYTKLWQRLLQEGRLLHTRGSGDFVDTRLMYRPSRPPGEILAEYLDWWEGVYEPSRFLSRAYSYSLTMRPTRAALARSRGETVSDGHPKSLPPLKWRLREMLAFFRLCWRFGVLAPCRAQFWDQLFGMRRRNPSRWKNYLNTLPFLVDISRSQQLIRQRVASAREEAQDPGTL